MSTSSQPPRKETPLTGEKSSTESESVLDPDLQRLRMFYGRALERGGLTRAESIELVQELQYLVDQKQFSIEDAVKAIPALIVNIPSYKLELDSRKLKYWDQMRSQQAREAMQRRLEEREHPLMREEREALTQRGMLEVDPRNMWNHRQIPLEVDPRGDSPFKDLRRGHDLLEIPNGGRIITWKEMDRERQMRRAQIGRAQTPRWTAGQTPCRAVGAKHMVHTKETWVHFETLARMGYLVEETAVLSPWEGHFRAEPLPKEDRARLQDLLKKTVSPVEPDSEMVQYFKDNPPIRITPPDIDWEASEEPTPGSSPSTPGTTSGSTLTWRARSSYLTNRDWSVLGTGPSNSSESPNETTGSC